MNINCIYLTDNLIDACQNEIVSILAKDLLTFGIILNQIQYINWGEQNFSCDKNAFNVVIKSDKVKYDNNARNVVVISDDIARYEEEKVNVLLPSILEQSAQYQVTQIKLFGVAEKDIKTAVAQLIGESDEIDVYTFSDNLDTTLTLIFFTTNQTLINGFIADVYDKLRKYIYSDTTTTLYRLALDLITIGNKNVSIVETITGGNIVSEFNKCCDANNLIKKSFVLSDENTLTTELGVNPNILKKYGLSSVECAYEVASAMLEKRPNDIVVVTCGKLTNGKNTCFIAIGDMDGIHVYKNSYIGSPERVVNTISKCAVFYLVKKLKQNDLFFNKIYV